MIAGCSGGSSDGGSQGGDSGSEAESSDILQSKLSTDSCADIFWIQSNPFAISSVIVDPEKYCIDFSDADWKDIMPEARPLLDAGYRRFFTVGSKWQNRGCGCNTDPTPKWFWQGTCICIMGQ